MSSSDPIPTDEDDYLPLSGLQHLLFCERQFALIHLEQTWRENRLTAQGRLQHRRVDEAATCSRPNTIRATGVWLRSVRLGLIGRADVVEFLLREEPEEKPRTSDHLPAIDLSRWYPYPVEYKRGKPKRHDADKVQLCAQAICLEEMLDLSISTGALFYQQTRRRQVIQFDDELRSLTKQLAVRMHTMFETRITPSADYGKHCRSCSLRDACIPQLDHHQSATSYLNKLLDDLDVEPQEVEF